MLKIFNNIDSILSQLYPILDDKTVKLDNKVYPRFGWAVFTLGGPGSGKSYNVKNKFLVEGKIFDADNLKEFKIHLIKRILNNPLVSEQDKKELLRPFNGEIPNLKNTEHNSLLHDYFNDKKSFKNSLNIFLKNVKQNMLPNIIIDTTGNSISSLIETSENLKTMGYQIAVVWVLNDLDTSIRRIQQRERNVDLEYTRSVHSKLINRIPALLKNGFFKNIDEFFLLYNNYDTDNNVVKLQKNSDKFILPSSFYNNLRNFSNSSLQSNKLFHRAYDIIKNKMKDKTNESTSINMISPAPFLPIMTDDKSDVFNGVNKYIRTEANTTVIEKLIVNQINSKIITSTINIKFIDTLGKVFECPNILYAKHVGKDTKDRKKADILLVSDNGKKYPISLKQKNSVTWESADTLAGLKARKIIDELVSNKNNNFSIDNRNVEKNSKIYNVDFLSHYIFFDATEKEKELVVFGSDILNNGFVAILKKLNENINDNIFISAEPINNWYEIEVEYIFKNLTDIPKEKEPIFKISNRDIKRRIKLIKYLGVRVEAVTREYFENFKNRRKNIDAIIVYENENQKNLSTEDNYNLMSNIRKNIISSIRTDRGENNIVNKINNKIAEDENNLINIRFKVNDKSSSYTKVFECPDIANAKHVGKDTANRKKADILLYNDSNSTYSISLKQSNAGRWESADTLAGLKARYVINKLVEENKIRLFKTKNKYDKNVYRISRPIIFFTTFKERKDVIFGNDILNNGAVIIRKNFNDNIFTSYNPINGWYEIEVDYILKELKDLNYLDDNLIPAFKIYNTGYSTKKIHTSIDIGYPGIRVEAFNMKEIKDKMDRSPLLFLDDIPEKNELLEIYKSDKILQQKYTHGVN